MVVESLEMTEYSLGLRVGVEGIPTYVTDNHNMNAYWWAKHGIRNAEVFRIDAHPDMRDSAQVCGSGWNKPDYWDELVNIANFNCTAFYYSLVSSFYWLNPLSHVLQDLGARNEEDRHKLAAKVDNGEIVWGAECIDWTRSFHDGERDIGFLEKVKIKGPFILDVDLDGFACSQDLPFYIPCDRVKGWERRMDETFDVLKSLKRKPNLITITRSYGEVVFKRFVPIELVDEIQQRFVRGLGEIYQHSKAE